MKRASVAVEEVSADYLEAIARAEEQGKLKLARLKEWKPVFVTVVGPHPGIYETWDDVKRNNGHRSGSVTRQFTKRAEAQAWYNAAQSLPAYGACLEVHVSSRAYDVTQERDFYAAVAIWFGPEDPRNFCTQARWATFENQPRLDIAIMQRALELIPVDSFLPVRIVCDSKHIVYGCNYGLWKWPKTRELGEPNAFEIAIRDTIKQRSIELVWKDSANMARKQAEAMCMAQYQGKCMTFERKYALTKCIVWLGCIRRLWGRSFLCRDLRKIIGKRIYRQAYRYPNAPF